MRGTGYVVIQSFMVDDLGLKGNELIVYAVIHGFTQDGNHWYYGTRAHLAEWCGATKGTVSNCLKSLLEKGYVERREIDRCGYRQVQYRAVFVDGVTKIGVGDTKNRISPVSKIDIDDTITSESNEKSDYSGNEICPICGSESERHGSVMLCQRCNTAWRRVDD
jgi:Transcriptional regulators